MEAFGTWCAGILCVVLLISCCTLAVIGCETQIERPNIVKLNKTDLIKSGHAYYQLDSITGETEFVLDPTFLKEK